MTRPKTVTNVTVALVLSLVLAESAVAYKKNGREDGWYITVFNTSVGYVMRFVNTDGTDHKVYNTGQIDRKVDGVKDSIKTITESVKTAQTTLTTKIDTDITSVKRELKSNLKTAQDQTSKRLNAILTAIDEELPQRLLNEEVRPLIKDMIAKEVKVQVQEELDMLRSELNKLREKVESLKK